MKYCYAWLITTDHVYSEQQQNNTYTGLKYLED